MKTKKFLSLTIVFLFLLMLVIAIIPSKAFATETMSDEFKQMLNGEGKLVVTDTSMSENKEKFLNEYISKYATDEYYYHLYDYKEDTFICNISRMEKNSGIELEMHEISVKYEEQYSDDFKKILKDKKIEYRNSSQNISEDWIATYISNGLKNDNYSFEISTYWDDATNTSKRLISSDYSKATIKMTEKSTRKTEQHIVELKRITEQSDNFKKYLNEDGKIEVKSVKPSNDDDFWALCDMLIWKEGMEISNIAKDFSYFDLTINYETHTVGIVYNYDESTETGLKGLTDKFTDDLDYFNVKDMELINYWVNTLELDAYDEFANYSGDLKAFINNYNIKFKFSARAGWGSPLYTENLGIYLISYDDVVYCVKSCIKIKAEHIIYVPNDTENTKEALMETAQKRIDEYLGKTGIATVSYYGKAGGLEEFPIEELGIEGLNENDDIFKITIKVGNKTAEYYIMIKRDTSKMVTPEYSSVDVKTEVGISSTSSTIPLDTAINSTKLTSGTEYERIMKILNIENGETFDLKLYSDSIKDYITELENGTFEVKLPVPKELERKNLIVYYVDSKGDIEEHEVTVKDGYAIFTTNHFSIYTLAEKKVIEETPDNLPTNITNETSKGEKDDTPKTGTLDIINYVLVTTFISAVGIVILKKKIS